MFPVTERSRAVADAFRWWLALELLGLLALPLTGLLFRALPDRGYSLSKVTGWLLVGWTTWLLASLGLAPLSRDPVLLATLGLAAVSSLTLFIHRGGYLRAWQVFFRERRAYIFWMELAFTLAFLALTVLRAYMPDIDQTEKPMEYMQLHSLYSTGAAPPDDLWMSGHRMNYYYFGYYLNAALGVSVGAPPEIAFNLSLAGAWALTFLALAGLGYNAVAAGAHARLPRVLGSLLAPLFVLLIGNPAGALAGWSAVRTGEQVDWWSPTRVVIDSIPGRRGEQQTINEFPAFSFLLGDLHPHVMSMPLFALGLAASLALFLSTGRPRRQVLTLTAFAGAVAGWLYMVNSWDVPVITLLAVLAVAFSRAYIPTKQRLREGVVLLAPLLPAATLVALPFLLSFEAPVNPDAILPQRIESIPVVSTVGGYVGVVWWGHTDLGEFLRVWGVHFLVLLLALITHRKHIPRGPWRILALLAAAALVPPQLLNAPLIMLLPAVALCLIIAARVEAPTVRWAFLLAAAGWSLVFVPELFYLRDVFENRMNTVFKFYYQAWQILGIASTLLLLVCADGIALPIGGRTRLRPLLPLACLLLAFSLLYPYTGVRARASGGYQGLDGAEFLRSSDPDAYAAAAWLRERSAPGDVVLEATGDAYSLYGRLATFSGRPTVLGWANHEQQWRVGQPELLREIADRTTDVHALYSPGSPTKKRSLLQKYGVRYVLYGAQERDMQRDLDLPVQDPFRQTLKPVARFPGAILYGAP